MENLVKLALIIHGFYIYQFAYLLKFTCNSKINTYGALWSSLDMGRVVEKSVSLNEQVPSEAEQGHTPLSTFTL